MSQPSSYQVPGHPSGLDMRVQVNQIMLAILGDNCGPTAPPETYPGMMWGDTANVRLKRRTNANDGWVDIGPLDDFLSEVRTLAKNAAPVGSIIMWWGDGNNVPKGWVKCDGNNGTPNMTDRFPCGAGGSLAPGAWAGSNSMALNGDHLPNHAHGVYDPGHAHGVGDPGHGHGVADGGHAHSMPKNASAQGGADNGGMPIGTDQPYFDTGRNPLPTNGAGANIGIYGSGTGIWIGGSGTGIGIYAAGNSAAFDNRPACIALWFLMKTAS